MKNTHNLSYPRNNKEEILFTLINRRHVSYLDFPEISNFSARISEIQTKLGIELNRVDSVRNSKFGNPFRFIIYRLPDKEFEKAMAIYVKMNPSPNGIIYKVN
jgi:hypothetical protein